MRKFKWRVNENMQGKNVQSASGTNVFTGTWLLLLQIPVSADHSVDIKKNTYPCGPKSGSQTTSEINVQNDITLKGGIANLERSHRLPRVLTISIDFQKPMSGPYMFSIAGFLRWLISERLDEHIVGILLGWVINYIVEPSSKLKTQRSENGLKGK